MPTYQYACTECGHAFEQVQSFSDDALSECPQCEGRLRKIFNAVGVVFKGSGFYRTDSRNGGKSGASSKPADSKSESKSETKSETKTETKSSDSSSSSSSSSPSTASKSTAPAA